jgi:hypothetical protein
VSFHKEDFFKKQIEECRELEKRAANAADRDLWRQAAARWEEQLRRAQVPQSRKRMQRYAESRQFQSEDSA